MLFPTMAAFSFPPTVPQGTASPTLSLTLVFRFSESSHPAGCELVSSGGLGLHFPNDILSFLCWWAIRMSSLGKCSVKSSARSSFNRFSVFCC